MIDEIYDRHYREARGELNRAGVRAVSRLGKAIHDAFEVLVGIEYSQPWAAKRTGARCN